MKPKLLLLTVLAIAAGGLAWYYIRITASPANAIPPEALQALQESKQMTIYSVTPDRERPRMPEDKLFHNYVVLGETAVTDPAARQRVAREIKQAVAATDDAPSMCFEPRHGIRVTRNSTTFDFLICFECEAIYTFIDDVRIDARALQGGSIFINELLQVARIPVAPSYGTAQTETVAIKP